MHASPTIDAAGADVARFPTLAVRVAALWVLLGAAFKLFAGSPNDLPPVVQSFSLFGFDPGPGLTLRLAVSIELVFVFTALLRPRWAWPWLVALYLSFLGVLVLTVQGLRETALEPVGFGAAMFDPEASCGCFGSKIRVPPGYMMIADGVLLLALLVSRPWRGRLGAIGPDWLPTGASVLALALPWMAMPGASKARSVDPGETPAPVEGDGEPAVPDEQPGTAAPTLADVRWVELRVEEWTGQLVYDLSFDPFPDDPDSAPLPFWSFFGLEEAVALLPIDAVAVIYRRSCEHCAEHLRELASNPPMTPDGFPSPIVLLELSESGEVQDLVSPEQLFPAESGLATYLALPPGPEYVFTTPGEFRLEGGLVLDAREGIGREDG